MHKSTLFPKYEANSHGSKVVHHFNEDGLDPISIEKPHGNREYVPQRFANFAMNGIEAVLDYIEDNLPETLEASGEIETELLETETEGQQTTDSPEGTA